MLPLEYFQDYLADARQLTADTAYRTIRLEVHVHPELPATAALTPYDGQIAEVWVKDASHYDHLIVLGALQFEMRRDLRRKLERLEGPVDRLASHVRSHTDLTD